MSAVGPSAPDGAEGAGPDGAAGRSESAGELPRLLTPRRRRSMALLVTNGVAQAAAGIGGALAVGRAFAALASPATSPSTPVWESVWSSAWGMAAVAAILAAATAWLRGAEQVLAERVGQSYVHAVRMRLLDHQLAAPDTSSSLSVTSRVSARA